MTYRAYHFRNCDWTLSSEHPIPLLTVTTSEYPLLGYYAQVTFPLGVSVTVSVTYFQRSDYQPANIASVGVPPSLQCALYSCLSIRALQYHSKM